MKFIRFPFANHLKIVSLISISIITIEGCNKNDRHVDTSTIPEVITAELTHITTVSVTTGGRIVSDGGDVITASGIVWSKTNATPTTDDNVLTATAINAAFSIDMKALDANAVYYLRAFATNSRGTGYGEVVAFYTFVDTGKVRFVYNGENVEYGIIVSQITGKKWLDRNLGAQQVATAFDDYKAYGDLFQWGRPADGHQLINWTSSTTGTPVNDTIMMLATSDVPGISKFIVPTFSPSDEFVIWDWRSDNNSNRWVTSPQGPCPAGWHVPSDVEWQAETAPLAPDGYPTGGTASSGGMNDRSTAYSQLKLMVAGYRVGDAPEMGQLRRVGERGIYWSSTDHINSVTVPFSVADGFAVATTHAGESGGSKSGGATIRCIQD